VAYKGYIMTPFLGALFVLAVSYVIANMIIRDRFVTKWVAGGIFIVLVVLLNALGIMQP
jgi:hypothetical protein